MAERGTDSGFRTRIDIHHELLPSSVFNYRLSCLNLFRPERVPVFLRRSRHKPQLRPYIKVHTRLKNGIPYLQHRLSLALPGHHCHGSDFILKISYKSLSGAPDDNEVEGTRSCKHKFTRELDSRTFCKDLTESSACPHTILFSAICL